MEMKEKFLNGTFESVGKRNWNSEELAGQHYYYKRDNSPHYTTMLNGSTQHDMFNKLITWAESAKHNQFLKWVVSYHLFKSVMTRLKSLNRLTK